MTYPADIQAERKGYRVLIDARKEIVFPTTSVVTSSTREVKSGLR